ncbi:MAG: cupin domain-containing protein [Byssovorax sp.]
MNASAAFHLAETPVHLGLGATVVREPAYVPEMEWYMRYGERHASDGVEGRLVSMHSFDQPWSSWEMHPKGAELVVCTEGAITLYQEINGLVRRVQLAKGEAVINPPGVWHTADCDGPCTALFITAGEGTETRQR